MTDQPFRLARYFEVFIEEQVKQQKFQSATAVVEEALRLLEKREAATDGLRRALLEGEMSGDPVPFDMEEIINEARAEAGLPPRHAEG
jgi:antitoxin ParD1/3/4